MLNGPGWPVTELEPDGPNSELARPVIILSWFGAVTGQFRNMDPLNHNRHGTVEDQFQLCILVFSWLRSL